MGLEAYDSLDTKAAVLLESLVRNYALVDGDKRLGWLAVVVFYGLNQVNLEATDDDAYELVVEIACWRNQLLGRSYPAWALAEKTLLSSRSTR